MKSVAERQYEHVGETHGMADHDYDLIHFLNDRLEILWRCDQYIANADGDADLQNFWRDVKKGDTALITRARQMIKSHVNKNCF
jgi:hypothetical protein